MKKIMIAALFIFLYGCSEEAVIMESHKNMSNIQLIDALKKADKEHRQKLSLGRMDELLEIHKNRMSLIYEIHERNLFKDMSIQGVQAVFEKPYEDCTKELYQPYEGSVCNYSINLGDRALYIYVNKDKKTIGSKIIIY